MTVSKLAREGLAGGGFCGDVSLSAFVRSSPLTLSEVTELADVLDGRMTKAIEVEVELCLLCDNRPVSADNERDGRWLN